MLQRTDEVSAPLAAVERAASRFECGILAARDAAIAENSSLERGSIGVLLDIGGTMRILKSEGRDAIGLLATSDRAEHRAMADACRARMADAVNLHRAACRCIKQGIVPPLPALDAAAGASKQEAGRAPVPDVNPIWPTVWIMGWTRAWSSPWTFDWR
jgi:hypothetical protein